VPSKSPCFLCFVLTHPSTRRIQLWWREHYDQAPCFVFCWIRQRQFCDSLTAARAVSRRGRYVHFGLLPEEITKIIVQYIRTR
jgi:hypothetical protein